jgi:acyl dehydratase/predicted transcriptional regulator
MTTTVAQILEAKPDRSVHTIAPTASVLDALKQMAEKNIGALVVVQGGRVVGIVSERDYARKIVPLARASKDTAMSEIMSRRVLFVHPGRTSDECMALMTDGRLRHLPVMEESSGNSSAFAPRVDLVTMAGERMRLAGYSEVSGFIANSGSSIERCWSAPSCAICWRSEMIERYLEDYAVGQRYGSGHVSVDPERIKSFAAEFDPQPFHLDEAAAEKSLFRGLAASGWHTAALTMKLLVGGELKPAGGIIGAGGDEIRWPRPTRPGDVLSCECEILGDPAVRETTGPGADQGPDDDTQRGSGRSAGPDDEPAGETSAGAVAGHCAESGRRGADQCTGAGSRNRPIAASTMPSELPRSRHWRRRKPASVSPRATSANCSNAGRPSLIAGSARKRSNVETMSSRSVLVS